MTYMRLNRNRNGNEKRNLRGTSHPGGAKPVTPGSQEQGGDTDTFRCVDDELNVETGHEGRGGNSPPSGNSHGAGHGPSGKPSPVVTYKRHFHPQRQARS